MAAACGAPADEEAVPVGRTIDELAPRVGACAIFPSDNPWNADISELPVHPNSDAFIAAIGSNGNLHPDFGRDLNGVPHGIPYTVVSSAQPLVPVEFVGFPGQSDPGPYPIPPGAPIEGGGLDDGDRHVIVLETTNCLLYELYRAYPHSTGQSWTADSGAIFDLKTNALRPRGWTSADAAGLPILPGLVRYDEVVVRRAVRHALRMTVERSQAAFIHPARHYASSDPNPALPPMGLRFRLKASYDCSGYSDEVQVICAALKRYGLIVADNGGSWFVSGAPDPRWNEAALSDLRNIPASALEAVQTGPIEIQ